MPTAVCRGLKRAYTTRTVARFGGVFATPPLRRQPLLDVVEVFRANQFAEALGLPDAVPTQVRVILTQGDDLVLWENPQQREFSLSATPSPPVTPPPEPEDDLQEVDFARNLWLILFGREFPVSVAREMANSPNWLNWWTEYGPRDGYQDLFSVEGLRHLRLLYRNLDYGLQQIHQDMWDFWDLQAREQGRRWRDLLFFAAYIHDYEEMSFHYARRIRIN